MNITDKFGKILQLLAEIRQDIVSEEPKMVNPHKRWANQAISDLKELERVLASDFAIMTKVDTVIPTITELREKWNRKDV